jgi:CheY-like chemotaxis protein
LGLAVVQGIVQQHEGLINAYSEPGIGTTFRVYLPASDLPGSMISSALTVSSTATTPRTTPATVLLAEDDPATRATACKTLRRHGCKVIAVADGEEACVAAAAHQGRIDVAVLDVVMPRLGGPETARRLMGVRPGMPIILCSGHPGAMPRQTQFTQEWHWLTKPYPAAELLNQIDAIIDKRPLPPA